MRIFVKNAILFVLLSIAFSSFAGCSNSGTSPAANSNGQTAANSTASGNSSSGSEYPPLSQTLMQADLKSLDGSTFKLADYKGKVVVVNFWATWCIPCKKEMPELVKLQEMHKDKGFEIIGVDADENDDAKSIKAFGEKMGLNYKLAQSEMDFYDEFRKISKKEGIPQSFIIDREGRLNGAFFGAADSEVARLKDKVGKLLAN